MRQTIRFVLVLLCAVASYAYLAPQVEFVHNNGWTSFVDGDPLRQIHAILGLIFLLSALLLTGLRLKSQKPLLVRSIYCCDQDTVEYLIKNGIAPSIISCPVDGINQGLVEETMLSHAFIIINANPGADGETSFTELEKASKVAKESGNNGVLVRFDAALYDGIANRASLVLAYLQYHNLKTVTSEQLVSLLPKN